MKTHAEEPGDQRGDLGGQIQPENSRKIERKISGKAVGNRTIGEEHWEMAKIGGEVSVSATRVRTLQPKKPAPATPMRRRASRVLSTRWTLSASGRPRTRT